MVASVLKKQKCNLRESILNIHNILKTVHTDVPCTKKRFRVPKSDETVRAPAPNLMVADLNAKLLLRRNRASLKKKYEGLQ